MIFGFFLNQQEYGNIWYMLDKNRASDNVRRMFLHAQFQFKPPIYFFRSGESGGLMVDAL